MCDLCACVCKPVCGVYGCIWCVQCVSVLGKGEAYDFLQFSRKARVSNRVRITKISFALCVPNSHFKSEVMFNLIKL